jgi:hypothetical protein
MVIYLFISNYFEMTKKSECCCEKPVQKKDPGIEIPEPIQKDLDAMGGITALENRIPPKNVLEMRGRIYQALSDPLRLTIPLYYPGPAALCLRHQPVHAALRFKTLLPPEYSQGERPYRRGE